MKRKVLSKFVVAQSFALFTAALALPAHSQGAFSQSGDEYSQLNNILNNSDAGRNWSAPNGNMGNGMMNGGQMGNMGGGMMNGGQMGNMGNGMMNGGQMGNMGNGMMNGGQMGNMGNGMMNGGQMGNMGGGMMNGSQAGSMGGAMGAPRMGMGNMGNMMNGGQMGNMGGMMGAPQMGGMMGAPANNPFSNLAKMMGGGQGNPLMGNVQSGNKGIGNMLQQFMQGNANSTGSAVGAGNPFNKMNLLKTFFGGAPGTSSGGSSSSSNSAEQQAKDASVTGQAEALFQRANNQAEQAVADAERANKGYGDKGSRLAAASSAQYHANDARSAADEAGNITYSGPQYAQNYAAQARAQANRAQEAADRAAYNAAQ